MALSLSPLFLDPSGLATWIDVIIGGVGVLGIVWTAWKWSFKAKQRTDKLNQLADNFDKIRELIDHELNHNSGSSMKDKAYKAVEISGKALDEARKAAASAERAALGIESLQNSMTASMLTASNEHSALWAAIHHSNVINGVSNGPAQQGPTT